MIDPAPRVQFESVSKSYPGVRALHDVSFSVAPGRVHAVVGENGAGKSTLVKILAGATQADAGFIRLDGDRVAIRGARHAQALGVAVVYQEFNLVADLTVAENVFLGRWPRGGLGWVRYRELHDRSRELFQSLGVSLDVRRRVTELGVAQQQMVEIARALALEAKVLVLDEPSAVLTPNELCALFNIVRSLTRTGASVVYISHRLDEIFELCDDVTVLRDGCHISTRPIGQVNRGTLIREMVGRPLEEEFPRPNYLRGSVVLRVEGLSCGDRFQDVSLELRRGEVFGLAGLVGAGRSSVGKVLFGADRATGGRIQIGDTTGPFRSPREAMRAGIAYLTEDRKREGLLLHRSLAENLSLPHLGDFSTAGILRRETEHAATLDKMGELRIKAPTPRVTVATLSGGNQQKVMIARWLLDRYRVIILDEPTRGVDVGAKVEIYELVHRMVAEGAAVLMITSELPEAVGMADRIAVMCRGRLTGIIENTGRNATQESILRLAVGEGPDGGMRSTRGACS